MDEKVRTFIITRKKSRRLADDGCSRLTSLKLEGVLDRIMAKLDSFLGLGRAGDAMAMLITERNATITVSGQTIVNWKTKAETSSDTKGFITNGPSKLGIRESGEPRTRILTTTTDDLGSVGV